MKVLPELAHPPGGQALPMNWYSGRTTARSTRIERHPERERRSSVTLPFRSSAASSAGSRSGWYNVPGCKGTGRQVDAAGGMDRLMPVRR
jgi:hypothetical protein